MDVKSVNLGASSGGSAVANRAQSMHREHGSAWYATESDSIVGQLRIRLSRSSKEDIAIIIAEDRNQVSLQDPFTQRLQVYDMAPLVGCLDRSILT